MSKWERISSVLFGVISRMQTRQILSELTTGRTLAVWKRCVSTSMRVRSLEREARKHLQKAPQRPLAAPHRAQNHQRDQSCPRWILAAVVNLLADRTVGS